MLDNEITSHLAEQLKHALAYIPSHHFDISTSVISAAAEFMFLLFTTGRQLPTPGQSMLYAARHSSYIACRASHVAYNTSHFKPHKSHASPFCFACCDILCMNISMCSTGQALKRAKSFGRRRSPESVKGLSMKRRMAFIMISCLLPLASDAVISRLMTPLSANESERAHLFRERVRSFFIVIRNVARFLGVVNAFAFIRHGKFRALPARIAGGCPHH